MNMLSVWIYKLQAGHFQCSGIIFARVDASAKIIGTASKLLQLSMTALIPITLSSSSDKPLEFTSGKKNISEKRVYFRIAKVIGGVLHIPINQ